MTDLRAYETLSRTRSHTAKVRRARLEIEHALKSSNRFAVCSSWGKDSCALVGLVLSVVGTGFDVVHLRSPYELPGHGRILEWASGRCVIYTVDTTRTLGDYVSWLQEHGLHYERESLLERGKASKRDDMLEWIREQGYGLQLLGMRAEESKGRRQCFRRRGLTYQAHGLTVCNPIGWWTTRDVWAYLVSRNIPWHPLYDCETHGETRETLRNGGWLSVHGCNDARVPWLRRHYPNEYRALRDAFPGVGRLG
jgi:phosphoadenosine phosphosulfate reductase